MQELSFEKIFNRSFTLELLEELKLLSVLMVGSISAFFQEIKFGETDKIARHGNWSIGHKTFDYYDNRNDMIY